VADGAVGDIVTFVGIYHRDRDMREQRKYERARVIEDHGWEKKIRFEDRTEVLVANGELRFETVEQWAKNRTQYEKTP
jgi:hypothetical protein